jgi:hypothetical protein
MGRSGRAGIRSADHNQHTGGKRQMGEVLEVDTKNKRWRMVTEKHTSILCIALLHITQPLCQ